MRVETAVRVLDKEGWITLQELLQYENLNCQTTQQFRYVAVEEEYTQREADYFVRTVIIGDVNKFQEENPRHYDVAFLKPVQKTQKWCDDGAHQFGTMYVYDQSTRGCLPFVLGRRNLALYGKVLADWVIQNRKDPTYTGQKTRNNDMGNPNWWLDGLWFWKPYNYCPGCGIEAEPVFLEQLLALGYFNAKTEEGKKEQ